jgi:hypothetical protein
VRQHEIAYQVTYQKGGYLISNPAMRIPLDARPDAFSIRDCYTGHHDVLAVRDSGTHSGAALVSELSNSLHEGTPATSAAGAAGAGAIRKAPRSDEPSMGAIAGSGSNVIAPAMLRG